MNMRKIWAAALFAAALISAGGAGAAADEPQTIYMVEVLPLKPGATVEQAEAYFETVSPIIASHGVFATQSYRVVDQAADAAPRVINIWRVARPDGLPEIFGDPAYLAHVRERDQIFDLPARLGWMTQELY